MQPLLALDFLHKAFKNKMVLNGVTFAVPPGSVVGLLGRNGAGKTTLMKCALGLLRIDLGKALVHGEDAWNLSAAAKEQIGYVGQEVALYPWMKARQLIDYTASFYPRWNHTLTDRLLREWDIDPSQRVAPMSVGQRQKLAIVLAMGHEPKLLVLDEPAASLDPGARRAFLQAMLDIVMDGNRAVLFSTHITSDLERIADRLAVLKDGKIIYDGELDALKDRVKRVHVSAARALPSTLAMPQTLHEHIDGSVATVTVNALPAQQIADLERTYDATVSVQDLNLEDIFLEMHDG